jgi:radical SAM protein (TIGR01212 family)
MAKNDILMLVIDMNPFLYSNDNKRYHTLNYYYQQKFNTRVSKISLNAHFTCPNIDGKVGYGGCIYCKQQIITDDLLTQWDEQKKIIDHKWPNSKYIGFFQSNTNTYAPLNILREKYEKILSIQNVIGLSISTRPDAIEDDVLDYLEELNKKTYLTVELGLQTIHESTAKLINRCHTLECFTNMVEKLRQKHINVVVHIINGLPHETKDMMIETIKFLSHLDIQGIKIHMLHIVKNTPLERLYCKEHFHILTKEEYVDIVCDQLELLPPSIVIHRLTGDPIKEDLVEPTWLIKKVSVLNDIDKELAKRNTYQGIYYKV